jgi:tripartite ATP-independent transporter DctM subunit
MSSVIVGLIGFVIILILIMFLKFPIGFSMFLVGFAGMACLTSVDAAINVLGQQVFVTTASYDMAVTAMFILMGELAFNIGLSDKAFESANKWLGNLRGGLGMATIGACGAFAAVCGSSPATAATVGSIALPEMKKYGYDDALATGSVAAGGVLGILIPPSVGFILFGLLTEQSISKLYMAGILPGILLTILFIITIHIVSITKPQGSKVPSSSIREKLSSLKGFVEVIVLFIIVIGGLFLGFFTPTEAGAVGVFGVLFTGLIKRNLSWQKLWHSLERATTMTGMILVIFIGAMIFSYFLAASTLPFRLGEMIGNLPVSPMLVMVAILLLWMVLGCIMDAIAMIMLTVPIVFPVITQLGLDPIWFGVLGVMSIEVGLITPPIGMNVYIIAGIAKGVPLSTIFRGVFPFVFAIIVCIALIIVFPEIALFLPSIL